MTDQHQPDPTPNVNPPCWEAVLADLRTNKRWRDQPPGLVDLLAVDALERDAVGRERYGTPLQSFNGRDALRDLYEELLDASVYAMQAQQEVDPAAGWSWRDRLGEVYRASLSAALLARGLLRDREQP